MAYTVVIKGGTNLQLENPPSPAGSQLLPSFKGLNLTNADFSGQQLLNADFTNATIAGADFSYANLRGAIFTGVSGKATFTGATLT
jgi:uncharacterized protein YjbI with pentapeptide repeats